MVLKWYTENTTKVTLESLEEEEKHRNLYVCYVCCRLCVMACCSKYSLLFISVNLREINIFTWWARKLLGYTDGPRLSFGYITCWWFYLWQNLTRCPRRARKHRSFLTSTMFLETLTSRRRLLQSFPRVLEELLQLYTATLLCSHTSPVTHFD